jgi:Transposase, Mutator family
LGGFDVHDDPPNGHVPTNPLERFNREIARRTDVVGIFPDDAPLIRLASILAIEQDDEWLVGRRYLSARVGCAAAPMRARRCGLAVARRHTLRRRGDVICPGGGRSESSRAVAPTKGSHLPSVLFATFDMA